MVSEKQISRDREESMRRGHADRHMNHRLQSRSRMSRKPLQLRRRLTAARSISCYGTSDTQAVAAIHEGFELVITTLTDILENRHRLTPNSSGAILVVILSKRSLRSEGSGRAARGVAFFAAP